MGLASAVSSWKDAKRHAHQFSKSFTELRSPPEPPFMDAADSSVGGIATGTPLLRTWYGAAMLSSVVWTSLNAVVLVMPSGL